MKQVLLCLLGTTALFAEPTCPLCELNRAYNEKHPGDYEYYEDYLKAQKEGKEAKKQATDSSNRN